MSLASACFLTLTVILATSPSMTADSDGKDSVHDRCLLLEDGMNYQQVLAIMQREPDSSLNGTGFTADIDGRHPTTFTTDFYHQATHDGRRLTSTVHYTGSMVDGFRCGEPDRSSPDASGAVSTLPETDD